MIIGQRPGFIRIENLGPVNLTGPKLMIGPLPYRQSFPVKPISSVDSWVGDSLVGACIGGSSVADGACVGGASVGGRGVIVAGSVGDAVAVGEPGGGGSGTSPSGMPGNCSAVLTIRPVPAPLPPAGHTPFHAQSRAETLVPVCWRTTTSSASRLGALFALVNTIWKAPPLPVQPAPAGPSNRWGVSGALAGTVYRQVSEPAKPPLAELR